MELTKWYDEHGTKLFVENLRYVIEKSDVNEGIMDTAEKEPANFWYFNNGVTAICDSFEKQPAGGAQTDGGVFDVSKISVINGAQTIGSLAKAKASGVKIDYIRVHMRIIALERRLKALRLVSHAPTIHRMILTQPTSFRLTQIKKEFGRKPCNLE